MKKSNCSGIGIGVGCRLCQLRGARRHNGARQRQASLKAGSAETGGAASGEARAEIVLKYWVTPAMANEADMQTPEDSGSSSRRFMSSRKRIPA